MANVNRANGLRPITSPQGSIRVNKYCVPASDGTAIYVGDAVKSGGTADADGVPTIARAAAGDTLRGVVVGFLPDTADSLVYRAASTLRYALVADDPAQTFEIQADNGGANLALVDVGENCDILATAGSTSTGQSAMELDSSTHATTSAQLRVLGFVQRADNAPASDYAKVLVKINEHELASTTGV